MGSAQNLTVGKRTLSDVEERLGIAFASTLPVAIGNLKSSVEVSGIGIHRVGNNSVNAVLLGQNLSFVTPGRSEAYGGVVNAALDWRPTNRVSIFASAEAVATNDSARSIVGKGGMRLGF